MKRSMMARGRAFFLAVVTAVTAIIMAGAAPVTVLAELVNNGDNHVVITPNVPRGRTGKRMSVTFNLENNDGETWEDVEVGFSEDLSYIARPDAVDGEYVFPFEVTSGLFDMKYVGTIRSGAKRACLCPQRCGQTCRRGITM